MSGTLAHYPQFSLGATGKEHKKFICSDAAFLLTLAIADNAPFGIKSLGDIQNIEILSLHPSIAKPSSKQICTGFW
jgi:hypothetical protein